MHRPGQMRRLRMLEEQKAWKREAGFDRIEITAEIDKQRLRTGFDSQHFYSKLYNTVRGGQTPDEYTLEMRVDVERLKMEVPFGAAAAMWFIAATVACGQYGVG